MYQFDTLVIPSTNIPTYAFGVSFTRQNTQTVRTIYYVHNPYLRKKYHSYNNIVIPDMV